MVILDVVIIGGGPHALTLASLLSNPGHDLSLSRTCTGPKSPVPNLEPSNTKRGSGRKKRRKAAAGTSVEEQQAKPAISEGVVSSPLSLRVVDSYGEWTTLWESQFAALDIPHLRSHTLVHTDPFNKEALQEFVSKHNLSRELHSLPDQVYILDENAFFNDMRLGKKERRRLNITSTLRKSLSFSLPGTKLSVDFFKDQVKRYKLDEVLIKGTVEQIIPVMNEKTDRIMRQRTEDEAMTVTESISEGSKKKVEYFQVKLRDGIILKASRVVVATGPTRAQMANIPSWVKSIGESFPEERLRHTVQLMHHRPTAQHIAADLACQGQKDAKELCVVHEAGQRVMVVGGGLTSAHIISIALKQGASHVTWVMRKHLQLKQFDVGDVETLVGRYSHVEHGIKMDGQAYLRQFYNERSLHKRLAMIHQARKGGAVTPEAYIHLHPYIQLGQVDVKTYCQVREASWCYRNQAWRAALSNGEHWHGDMIWLATGCKLDVKQDPLLSEVMKEFPIQVIDGWPCISERLQWAKECPLYLMGQYTALQIGPHAVNLAGGQAASMRIAKDITGRRGQDVLKVSEQSGEKSKTEEYVQQMKGLLWL